MKIRIPQRGKKSKVLMRLLGVRPSTKVCEIAQKVLVVFLYKRPSVSYSYIIQDEEIEHKAPISNSFISFYC